MKPTYFAPERPRIAQLVETMNMGGAEHLAVKIANHLAVAGYDSHLIVLHGPDVLSEKVAPGVHVHYFDFERSSITNPVMFAVSLRRGLNLIRRVVEQEKISVVQTHLPQANFFGLLLAWRKVCAVLATIHNNREFSYGDADNAVLLQLRKWAYRCILMLTQGVVAVSPEVKESLVAELGVDQATADRIRVVTNAVAVPAPISAEQVVEIRRNLGCGVDDFFVLAAGRFCEQKNYADLITAAGFLKKAGRAFHLVICGEGEQWPEVKARVEAEGLGTAVTLPGNVTNLDEVMQAADVFVMSSLWEGLPLVLLEAMAAGLPAVAYGIAGIVEVVSDGESGLLVPVGQPEVLAERLADLEQNRGRLPSMARAGKARVEAVFGFSEYMAKLTDIYEAVSVGRSGEKR